MYLLLSLSCLAPFSLLLFIFFFFNDTATTEIYTLSLHDALPIYRLRSDPVRALLDRGRHPYAAGGDRARRAGREDRKSTRLNSSHMSISYAVFCLKKKKKKKKKNEYDIKRDSDQYS